MKNNKLVYVKYGEVVGFGDVVYDKDNTELSIVDEKTSSPHLVKCMVLDSKSDPNEINYVERDIRTLKVLVRMELRDILYVRFLQKGTFPDFKPKQVEQMVKVFSATTKKRIVEKMRVKWTKKSGFQHFIKKQWIQVSGPLRRSDV